VRAAGRGLNEDLKRELGGAAALEQLGGPVQIDIGARRELGGRSRGIAGPLELLGTPPLDELLLGGPDVGFRCRHLFRSSPNPLFGKTREVVLPMPGDLQN
jgi:hypothetical protein